MREIASLFGLLRHPVIDEFLSTLLDFAQIDSATSIEIFSCAKQTVPDALGRQAAATRVVPTLLIREGGSNLDRVLL